MAKKKPQPEPEPEPVQEAPTEAKKPAGRTIGAWRKETLRFLGKGALDSEVTEHILKIAKEAGHDYETTDEETKEWRNRVQSELDGFTPTTTRSRASAAAAEPSLSDLMAVMKELKEAELPDTDGLSPVEAWQHIIDKVEGIASKVDGIQNLKRCLDAAAGLAALAQR